MNAVTIIDEPKSAAREAFELQSKKCAKLRDQLARITEPSQYSVMMQGHHDAIQAVLLLKAAPAQATPEVQAQLQAAEAAVDKAQRNADEFRRRYAKEFDRAEDLGRQYSAEVEVLRGLQRDAIRADLTSTVANAYFLACDYWRDAYVELAAHHLAGERLNPNPGIYGIAMPSPPGLPTVPGIPELQWLHDAPDLTQRIEARAIDILADQEGRQE